jgi:hypothetical protein
MLRASATLGRNLRSHLPRHLLASVAFAGALLGLTAAGGAAPTQRTSAATAPTGGLTIWVDSLPRGLEPRVRVRGPGGARTITRAVTELRLRPGVYTIVAGPVEGGARRYFPRRPRVSARVRPGGTAVALVDYINVVPRTTRSLSRGMARRLLGTTPTALVFQGSAPIALAPGDVVVAGPGPRMRDGLLRRIVSVRQEAGRTIVRTRVARRTPFPAAASTSRRGRASGSGHRVSPANSGPTRRPSTFRASTSTSTGRCCSAASRATGAPRTATSRCAAASSSSRRSRSRRRGDSSRRS